MLNRKLLSTVTASLVLILSCANLTACRYGIHPSEMAATPAIYSDLEGRAWVEKCLEQHPEILWLADANVRKTEEGNATAQGAYSEQLFGQKYIEFDRTIMTLHCLRLILDGSDEAYEQFTQAQPADIRLSKESFRTIHDEGTRLLQSYWNGMSTLEMAGVMETALVLGDMGKSEKARSIFAPYHIHAPDHDDFHGEAMKVLEKNPSLCPSFEKLSSSAKKLLVEIANLAHYGHVTHLEGTTSMLTKLRESQIAAKDPIALSLDLFVHLCDVAGAAGQVNNRSSLVYSELTHRAMQAMSDSVKVLSDPTKTENDAYSAYIDVRATWLGLDPMDKSNRVLARIGAMMRLFTPEEGAVLRKALLSLDTKTHAKVIAHLDVSEEEQLGRTPTYMPAVLVNLMNNKDLGATKEERLTQTVQLGLPFISRVLKKHKSLLATGKADPTIPLNFNKAAGVAKTSPSLLKERFTIDAEGNVICAGS